MTEYEAFARVQLPKLLRYAVMLTGERELAADLVQDVLIKVFHRWTRVAAAERPDRYAMQMVTNQYLSWRRRWAVRTIYPTAELPDRAHTHDLAQAHALREDLWARLATLPRRQRAVVVLRYYEQLTDPEIAELLGCSAVTVRGYAHRALARLRADLAAETAADQRADVLAQIQETQ